APHGRDLQAALPRTPPRHRTAAHPKLEIATQIRMKDAYPIQRPRVPPRALALSMCALAVPVIATALPPDAASGPEPPLRLLTLAQVAAALTGREISSATVLLPTVSAYIIIALAIGALSELLHRELARAEARALTDELTGLPNRRWARLMLETEFAAAQRGRS